MMLPLLDRWATRSQQQSCRNAMIASTRLTQRRAETREVEEYLTSLGFRAPYAGPPAPAGRRSEASAARIAVNR